MLESLHAERVSRLGLILIIGGIGLGGCTYLTKGEAEFDLFITERGAASWYGREFHARPTASGEAYDMYALTAAHRSLPLGSVVRVTNVANGRQVVVKINDRGPYRRGRILDLSYGAAEVLHVVEKGVTTVQVEVVGQPWPKPIIC